MNKSVWLLLLNVFVAAALVVIDFLRQA